MIALYAESMTLVIKKKKKSMTLKILKKKMAHVAHGFRSLLQKQTISFRCHSSNDRPHTTNAFLSFGLLLLLSSLIIYTTLNPKAHINQHQKHNHTESNHTALLSVFLQKALQKLPTFSAKAKTNRNPENRNGTRRRRHVSAVLAPPAATQYSPPPSPPLHLLSSLQLRRLRPPPAGRSSCFHIYYNPVVALVYCSDFQTQLGEEELGFSQFPPRPLRHCLRLPRQKHRRQRRRWRFDWCCSAASGGQVNPVNAAPMVRVFRSNGV